MFSKKTIFLTLIFSAIAFINGCQEETNNPISAQPKNVTIWPLNVGNIWSYRDTSFDSSANITDGIDMVFYIEGDTVINGQTWYRPNVYAFNGAVYLRNSSDGFWTYNLTNLDSSLWFKYPAVVNDSYIFRGLSEDTLLITVISINDTITTPLGSYVCYHYQWQERVREYLSIHHIYVAPKVGIIKSNSFNKMESGSFYMNWISELKQLVLN